MMGLDLYPDYGLKLDESPHLVPEIASEWGRNPLVSEFESQFDDYFRVEMALKWHSAIFEKHV